MRQIERKFNHGPNVGLNSDEESGHRVKGEDRRRVVLRPSLHLNSERRWRATNLAEKQDGPWKNRICFRRPSWPWTSSGQEYPTLVPKTKRGGLTEGG